MPIESSNFGEYAEAVNRAHEAGMDAAAETLVGDVKGRLGRRGAGVASLREGLAIIRSGKAPASKRKQRLARQAQGELDTGSLVDPPGGHPRARGGFLQSSASYAIDEDGTRVCGYESQSPGHTYGAVHEFGATIQGKPWLVFQLLTGEWRKVRQVTIPARPVWRPAFRGGMKKMMNAYTRLASEFMERK